MDINEKSKVGEGVEKFSKSMLDFDKSITDIDKNIHFFEFRKCSKKLLFLSISVIFG